MNAFEFYGYDTNGIGLQKQKQPNYSVKISDNDKIISIEDNGALLAQVGLEYDIKSHTLKLSGKESESLAEVELPLSIKRLVSSSFDMESTSIILKFENTDGSECDFSLDVEDLVNIYQAGNGIIISDENVISLKLNEDNNTLTLDENGLGIDLTNVDDKILALSGAIESIEIVAEDEFTYDLIVSGITVGTINIPKHQILKDVRLDGDCVVFEFYVEGGDIKQISVDLSKFKDIYTNGDGLNLIDKKFSIKLDDSSEPYLSLSENGLKFSGLDTFTPKYAESAKVAHFAFGAIQLGDGLYVNSSSALTIGNTDKTLPITVEYATKSTYSDKSFNAVNGLSKDLKVSKFGKLKVLHSDSADTAVFAETLDDNFTVVYSEHANIAEVANRLDESFTVEYAKKSEISNELDENFTVAYSEHANIADVANSLNENFTVLYAINAEHSVNAIESEHSVSSDKSIDAENSDLSKLSNTSQYALSLDSNFTVEYAIKSNTAVYAESLIKDFTVSYASLAQTAIYSQNASRSLNSDSSIESLHALKSDEAITADTAGFSEEASHSDKADLALTANTALYAETTNPTELNALKEKVEENKEKINNIDENGSTYVRNKNFVTKDELDERYALQTYAKSIDISSYNANSLVNALCEGFVVQKDEDGKIIGEIGYDATIATKPFDELWKIVHALILGMDEKNIKPLKDILDSLDSRIKALEEKI